jgi:5-methylcytosine-specific restriction endonuclease McrA
MAKNTGKSRDPVKWVRDRAKSAYDKDVKCAICWSEEDLEFHHFHSMTDLFEKWMKLHHFDINNEDVILEVRDQFISEHHKEIYNDVVTLCNKHHLKLHQLYGAKPAPATAAKQAAWVEKQREKINGSN